MLAHRLVLWALSIAFVGLGILGFLFVWPLGLLLAFLGTGLLFGQYARSLTSCPLCKSDVKRGTTICPVCKGEMKQGPSG